jgi:hypothetical protein
MISAANCDGHIEERLNHAAALSAVLVDAVEIIGMPTIAR